MIRGNNVGLPVDFSGVLPSNAPGVAPLPCGSRGTRDVLPADADDYVLTTVVPDAAAPANGAWLPVGVTFCAFGFRLVASDRVTDGRSGYPELAPWYDLIGLSYGP